jgi:hypothetical protein
MNKVSCSSDLSKVLFHSPGCNLRAFLLVSLLYIQGYYMKTILSMNSSRGPLWISEGHDPQIKLSQRGARMAYRTSWPNTVYLVCVFSSPKQQPKSTQRSINWPYLEEEIKSANLPAMQLKLHLTLRKGTCGGKKFSLFYFRRPPLGLIQPSSHLYREHQGTSPRLKKRDVVLTAHSI